MPDADKINEWHDKIRDRYVNYLRTSFYFKDEYLRESFRRALDSESERQLLKGPFAEQALEFEKSADSARDLAQKRFGVGNDLWPALLEQPLYSHQKKAIRAVTEEPRRENIVVATGTASGKTESFLYPILFELYKQHTENRLGKGVRALILYPMNALANDQRERLGKICKNLAKENSSFKPTFGQYIGETPKHEGDTSRNAKDWEKNRQVGELVFRKEMRETPPNILLTNYSMLEYLLIRQKDSELFDNGASKDWRFIVLDEAHQYRGTRGMEMGMLVRRLKQRVRDGGRGDGEFSCIATSATIASETGDKQKKAIADFAHALFDENFSPDNVIVEEEKPPDNPRAKRFHLFAGALEGAFLTHRDGKDEVVLNRISGAGDGGISSDAIEIALCRECGQHYYVGRQENGRLKEAMRDPGHEDFRVEFYMPIDDGAAGKDTMTLCRQCGVLSASGRACDCGEDKGVLVMQCETHPDEDKRDQLKECATCGYHGGASDPVREVVHGSDGPNSVIATALHQLLPKEQKKILSFADSRQEAAFFAWYVEDTYNKVRDRNFLLRALKLQSGDTDEELSVDDWQTGLSMLWENEGWFADSDSPKEKKRQMLEIVCREAIANDKRISLSGVGLAKWSVNPPKLKAPELMFSEPWNFTEAEARELLSYLLDGFRSVRAMGLPVGYPLWGDVSPSLPQGAFCPEKPAKTAVREWGHPQSSVVSHFLFRMLPAKMPDDEKKRHGRKLMTAIWDTVHEHDDNVKSDDSKILMRAPPKLGGDAFVLNPKWLRVKSPRADEIYECKTCASLSVYNIRGVCPRHKCRRGTLAVADEKKWRENHYRKLYADTGLPPELKAQEHTAQISAVEARKRQDLFKKGGTHLLSSSTTFEVGVDLGDLDVAFLRNVPPEPFNYTQRVGRVGRRDNPGLALTYCRRNPHDLYHYADPENRVMRGKVNPPMLALTNEKIILRHITAVALSAFLKQPENEGRLKSVGDFVRDWGETPRAAQDIGDFCRNNPALEESLRAIVPDENGMHTKTGLRNGGWVGKISGDDSTLYRAEMMVRADYRILEELEQTHSQKSEHEEAGDMKKRKDTIAKEDALVFLSRKAVIPKYGFPVDVVELDTRPMNSEEARKVSLQRDLSQAIAEYAPGNEVFADKKVWESCGIKKIPGKEFRVKCYKWDSAHNFEQWDESKNRKGDKYLSPEFGFVTPLHKKPGEPRGRNRRLYTTRPFFMGFEDEPEPKEMFGVTVTKAAPGSLVVLCEGKGRKQFYICRDCGAHYAGKKKGHKTPEGKNCDKQLAKMSLGHEFVTDVVRLQFPGVTDAQSAYSLAYAVLWGAAETLSIPAMDLNVTITGKDRMEIVSYDNVPGGAGLVAQLWREEIFEEMLHKSQERVIGGCGCDASCYGCLRSYRNQFVHPDLHRQTALGILQDALRKPIT